LKVCHHNKTSNILRPASSEIRRTYFMGYTMGYPC
jgi:hypothetical protein